MLSYQHGYHAGNFADVVKHLVLVHIMSYLTQKEKPLFYLETHAGKGSYELKHAQTDRLKEYQTGILPLWEQRQTLPEVFTPYLNIIQTLNLSEHLKCYPGSPYFAIQSLRPQDRIYLCEAHPQEYDALLRLPKQNKRVHFANEDGWQALHALLPPVERRGLIFMDPSYEIKTEYQTIPKKIEAAYARFPQGVYCLWYPMTPSHSFQMLTQKLQAKFSEKVFHLEFFFNQHQETRGLYGTGMWVLNAPFSLEETLRGAMKKLTNIYEGSRFTMLPSA